MVVLTALDFMEKYTSAVCVRHFFLSEDTPCRSVRNILKLLINFTRKIMYSL